MNQQVTTHIDDKTLAMVTNRLQEVGLNLVTTLAAHSLGPEIGREDLGFNGGTILLLGNAGQGFWQQFRQNWPDGADPVDRYSALQSEKILNDCLPDVAHKLLFPVHDCAIYLQRLMRAAGWHTTSPLGIGMHSQYGLWSACRAVWWLDADAGPAQSASQRTDHCASCLSKACVSSCPAGALRDGVAPNLSRCADYRVSHASRCAGTCVAREACPVAVNHRYRPEQLNYHYELARSAIVRYRSDAAPKTENKLDRIFIEGLAVEAILGIFPEERVTPQPVVFDVEFVVDTRAAASSEDIEQTVSYATVAEEISALALAGRYQLVETLAQACADLLFNKFAVPWVRIKITKPNAVSNAAGVGVVIERGER